MEIYSDKITMGRRTYFFDIKKSEKGELYLVISESKKTGDVFEHHHLFVFEENINGFSEIFQKTLEKFKDLNKSKLTDAKAYSVKKIRETYEHAYLPWTLKDDRKLELLFCEGKQIKEIAQILGRNGGAIFSRINKLELKEKYGQKSDSIPKIQD